MRQNGILAAISSLPSSYGIGDFGATSYEFINLLKRTGINFWQMLPINPLGGGNSPYQSSCSFAIDPIYVDLKELEDKGLIDNLKSFNERKKRVDFPKVRTFKEKLLREAFSRQTDTKKASFKNFLKDNPWVETYAKYGVLVIKNNYKAWYYWDKIERYDPYEHKFDYKDYEDEILYIEWCQFIVYQQFLKFKKYANQNGISLMGDIPFYVGENSSDAWANQDEFLLDENDRPSKVAGVPPDYFSKEGQRWGNPCYDWEYMKDDNFTFWIERIRHASKLYDYLRIDHFRAFDSYWAINPECSTAIDGEWKKAYGDEFFKTIEKEGIQIKLFAEDLGEPAPGVEILRDKYNLPGMNVIEFAVLDPKFDIRENQIAYTGTHDNQTLKGWINSLKPSTKEELKILLRGKKVKGRTLFDKLLNYTLSSPCSYACIPLCDYLKLDDSARMNTPGTCGSPNWEFRITNYADFIANIGEIKELLKKNKR